MLILSHSLCALVGAKLVKQPPWLSSPQRAAEPLFTFHPVQESTGTLKRYPSPLYVCLCCSWFCLCSGHNEKVTNEMFKEVSTSFQVAVSHRQTGRVCHTEKGQTLKSAHAHWPGLCFGKGRKTRHADAAA